MISKNLLLKIFKEKYRRMNNVAYKQNEFE